MAIFARVKNRCEVYITPLCIYTQAGSRPSTAQRLGNTSGGSGTDAAANTSTSYHHSSTTSGRRRPRRRNKSNSTSSRTPTPAHTTQTLQTPPSALSLSPTHQSTLPPPDLTTLEQTAERVARSTGAAVQKLSLRKVSEEAELERSHSEPNLTSGHEDLVPSVRYRRQQLVDSQGYSSGDEASPQGSPRRPVQSDGQTEGLPAVSHLTSHSHHAPTQPFTADSSTPHSWHTSPVHPSHTHSPADISYPSGYSSAEKAAHVARLVADSTGSAVQKLSTTMAERQHLSLSDSRHSNPTTAQV